MVSNIKKILFVVLAFGNILFGVLFYLNAEREQLKDEKAENKLFVLRAIFETNKNYMSNQLLEVLSSRFEIQHRELSIILIPQGKTVGDKEYLDLELQLDGNNEILAFDYFKP